MTNTEQTYAKILEDFGLAALSEADKAEMILGIADTIQKQFLQQVYKQVSEEEYQALEASAAMGMDFYMTTLKHLVPNHQEMLQAIRTKTLKAFKEQSVASAIK